MPKRADSRKVKHSSSIFIFLLLGIILVFILMKLFSTQPAHIPGPRQQSSTDYETASANLRDYIQQIVDTELPVKDSGIFSEPTPAEAEDFTKIIKYMEQEKYEDAQKIASTYNYTITVFTDTGYKDTTYSMLKENVPYSRGWGIFLVSPGSNKRNILIEVPHPIDDIYTAKVGVDMLRRLGAAKLFIAGTNRNARSDKSSDTAHNEKSLFYLLSEKFSDKNNWVIQPHGFNKNIGDPDYVISDGTQEAPAYIKDLTRAIDDEGLVAKYFPSEISKLGATTNVEGKAARAKGSKFIHLESTLDMRNDYANYDKVIRALAKIIQEDTR